MSRYESKRVLINDNELYEDTFEDRGVPYIRQYGTANLIHPTSKQIQELERIGHVWKLGDRFYNLAHQYYGDSRYWWVIAWYNRKPTEAHVKTGEVISIPMPFYKIIAMLRNG